MNIAVSYAARLRYDFSLGVAAADSSTTGSKDHALLILAPGLGQNGANGSVTHTHAAKKAAIETDMVPPRMSSKPHMGKASARWSITTKVVAR